MRYCGHFLIKAEGGAKNYKRDHPLSLFWSPFTVILVTLYRRFLAAKGVRFAIKFCFVLDTHDTDTFAINKLCKLNFRYFTMYLAKSQQQGYQGFFEYVYFI